MKKEVKTEAKTQKSETEKLYQSVKDKVINELNENIYNTYKNLTVQIADLKHRLDYPTTVIRYCKKCKHLTPQQKCFEAGKDYRCLVCGTMWVITVDDKEVKG